eukprot:scaffold31183_cov51-Phaeocystis_antarctica.AAC.1
MAHGHMDMDMGVTRIWLMQRYRCFQMHVAPGSRCPPAGRVRVRVGLGLGLGLGFSLGSRLEAGVLQRVELLQLAAQREVA